MFVLWSVIESLLCVLCVVCVCCCVVFFFQAEDGIRDLVRSRGLGDVYKRQVGHVPNHQPREAGDGVQIQIELLLEVFVGQVLELAQTAFPVSYTHLTLPTSDLV